MGTNTGLGIGIGIPFKNFSSGGRQPLPPDLKASLKGVWIAYGKSNNDADRSIVKNLVDPDNPFVISNAAYKLNSGYGKYEEDFTTWVGAAISINNGAGFKIEKNNTGWWGFSTYGVKATNEFKIKVTNCRDAFSWRYKDAEGIWQTMNITKDGIYTLPASQERDEHDAPRFFSGNPNATYNGLTVEQIPSYQGAFVTDGINDLITSTKTVQEMLGGSNEITVVSMMANLDSRQILCNSNYNNTNGYNPRNTLEPNGVISMLGYTDKNGTTNNLNLIMGDKDSIKLTDKVNFNSDYVFYPAQYYGSYYKAAWYWTVIANKVLTTDEINQVIAYFNLDRTLKPDILCDVKKQGITNDNHAEFGDKLIDFSGNGRDIQLNNLAWDGDSGIGKYNYPNWKVNVTQGNKYARIIYYDSINGTYSANFKGITDFYKSYGLSIEIRINRANTIDFHSIKEDGIYTMTPPDDTTSIDIRFGGENVYNASCDITITQIPSHAGALCLDGVNDFGKVTGMPVYKDYTFIIDRQIISIGDTAGVVASKSENSSDATKRGAFIFEYLGAPDNVSTWSFYKDNGKVANTDFTRGISYQSKYSYNGKDLTVGTSKDSDKLWLGTIRDRDPRFFNGAIYSLMSFPYSMSKFLIERQLKKYKLGTLYPDMVEFRPIVKSNNKWDIIEIWQGDKSLYRPTINDDKTGIYLKKDSTIGIYVKPYVGQKVSEIVYNGVSYTDLKLNSNGFYYITVPVTKSPQKIGITIEQDENYVLFNPVINSNYDNYKLTFHLREYEKLINIGDYIPKGTYIRANLYLKNNIDELVTFTFNGVNINYRRSSVDDTAFNIRQIYNYDSPQEVNITIDEYIRYEDIDFTNCYPGVPRIYVNDKSVTWGDKLKVGDEFTFYGNVNILPEMYNVLVKALYNGEEMVYGSIGTISKSMVFTSFKTYIFDDNEPKCILSPRLLSIPNSSYKILGYIPDISGHGNNGVIHNSAYTEGSGVNEDGSYQFDGVDDFVTIPTVTGGKQVLMKVNWQSNVGAVILYDQSLNISDYEFAIYNGTRDLDDNPVMAYQGRNNGQTYIDGILNSNIMASELKAITHNITITNELSAGVNKSSPVIGSNIVHNDFFVNMALYDFMLFDEISTEAKIKELNTYIGITPKVTLPNYYWDNYGKKNTDANRGYIDEQVSLQKTGTSVNPLENFNISYEGMSGYNGYPVVFGASKTWESLSGVYDYTSDVTNTTIHVTHAKHAGNGLLFSYVKKDGALTNIKEIPAFRVTIGGLEGNSKFGYRYLATEDATEETLVYLGNGTHELSKSFTPTEALLDLTRNVWVGIFITPMIEDEVVFDCDITIEVLPEYENGLAYDGVSDFTDNKNIPIFTDFTAIIKRVDLDAKNNNSTLIFKGDRIYLSGIGNGFILDYCYDNINYIYSYGRANSVKRDNSKIIYLTPESYNGNPIIKGENRDNLGLVLGKYWRGIIYKAILYSKTISLLEINFLKNLMEKDEIIDINHPIFISNTEDESNTSQDT